MAHKLKQKKKIAGEREEVCGLREIFWVIYSVLSEKKNINKMET